MLRKSVDHSYNTHPVHVHAYNIEYNDQYMYKVSLFIKRLSNVRLNLTAIWQIRACVADTSECSGAKCRISRARRDSTLCRNVEAISLFVSQCQHKPNIVSDSAKTIFPVSRAWHRSTNALCLPNVHTYTCTVYVHVHDFCDKSFT